MGLAVYRVHRYTTQAVHMYYRALSDSRALTAHFRVVHQNQHLSVLLVTSDRVLSLLAPVAAIRSHHQCWQKSDVHLRRTGTLPTFNNSMGGTVIQKQLLPLLRHQDTS